MINKSRTSKLHEANVALFKAALILAAAVFVVGRVAYGVAYPGTPVLKPWAS